MSSASRDDPPLPGPWRRLTTALVCDALDAVGRRAQSPQLAWPVRTFDGLLAGRAKTTLWADMAHEDPKPYELELLAVDTCRPGEVIVAAAGGSLRSAIWGDLLSTAARSRGAAGALVDGASRDLEKVGRLGFAVLARGTSVYDSRDRQRVTDIDVAVEVGGVMIQPGEIVLADADGVVIVPRDCEEEVLQLATRKLEAEGEVRRAFEEGLGAREVFRRYGVL